MADREGDGVMMVLLLDTQEAESTLVHTFHPLSLLEMNDNTCLCIHSTQLLSIFGLVGPRYRHPWPLCAYLEL